jgi:NAD(P)-dependent dehydrogenase (short-subunit alcohol dehydrogenase family)
MRYREKVVVVTGGGGEIGAALARGFANEGASLVIADLRAEAAWLTSKALHSAGMPALPLAVDVARLDDLDAMVAAALERFGRIDVLCNTAGMPSGPPDIFAITEAEWDRCLEVNLKGAFFASQKVGRAMALTGGGAILNTSSTSAYIASTRPAIPYDAAKGGLRQLTVSLAAHLVQHGIRVNAIAPGTIDTRFAAGLVDEETRLARLAVRVAQRIPMRRPGRPNDLVGAALFLCSEEASYITGQSLVIDGGILLV